MKTVILAGGFGTRLSEYTDIIPKPMVKIGNQPILWHIMKRYEKFNINDFYIALGYKSELIKNYFLNYNLLNNDFSITLSNGKIEKYRSESENWNVTLVDTGIQTMTGGRLKQLKEFLSDDTFMLTYGDGLADIDISKLIDFHKNHKKIATITAVRPPARFGELELDNEKVVSFKEKPQLNQGWINGGFMVLEPEFIDLIDGNSTLLEREPLELVASKGELMAYRHDGFWQCMDTKRDKELLENLYLNNPPWIN